MPTSILDKVEIKGLIEETGSKPVLVWNPSTRRVSWQKSPNARIDALEAKLDPDNNFKTITGYTFDAETRILTMNAGWVATIKGVDYTNLDEQVFPAIPLAASGYSRIDLIVFKTDSTFEIIPGQESIFTPIAPAKPENTLQATFFTVDNGVITVPPAPKPKAPVTSVNGMRGDVLLDVYTKEESNMTMAVEVQSRVYSDEYLQDQLNTLNATKVDKVPGERLINAAEITKLAAVTNVTTTVKTITSASLATQDVAGFVAYINALAVVLVVGANEIVEYQLSDTGRLFKLLLRGRSFGVGQAAIVAADVEEVTLWMNKDIKLSNYPNTRNDGQLPTNRVLSTDVNGNLKMYTIATAPAPYLKVLVPDSTLPGVTTNFTLKGAFFTPTMTVSITGQTINYITFVSDNLVNVNVTTGTAEGSFAVTLNNGLSATFNNALLIVLGTIYKPAPTDWINVIEPVNFEEGQVLLEVANSLGTATWSKEFDVTKNFRIYFKRNISPILTYDNSLGGGSIVTAEIISVLDGSVLFSYSDYYVPNFHLWAGSMTTQLSSYISSIADTNRIDYVNGMWYFYTNNTLKHTSSVNKNLINNVRLKIRIKRNDIIDIKYIELAT